MPEPPIWDLLRSDHQAIRALIARLRDVDEQGTGELFKRIVCELTAHVRAEEAVLYGQLLHQEPTRAKVVEGLAEHKRIETTLAELERIRPGEARWAAQIGIVEDALGHHFQVEEAELLPLAQQLLSPAQASELGARYIAERARLKGDLAGPCTTC